MLIALVEVSIDGSIALDLRKDLDRLILHHKVKSPLLVKLILSGVEALPDSSSPHTISVSLVVKF